MLRAGRVKRHATSAVLATQAHPRPNIVTRRPRFRLPGPMHVKEAQSAHAKHCIHP